MSLLPLLYMRVRLASRAIIAFTAAWGLTWAQSPSAAKPDLTLLREIQQEEFEPAVGEQIRLAYNETLRTPENADTVGRLGMILQCYRKYELAEICYRRATALSPHSLRWVYCLGNIEGWLGKNQEAIHHVREALMLDEHYTPARVRLAQLLFESGDVQQSGKEYEECIRQNPRLAEARLGRGRVHAAQGAWLEAIASYREACNLFQNYAAAHYALGMAYRKTGERTKSLEELEFYQRFKKAPQPAEDPLIDAINSLYAGGNTHFINGSWLVQQRKPQQAAAEFESALKLNPRLIMAHVNLIAMYGELGQPTLAEEHFREAVKLDPGWAEAYYNWGLLLSHERKSSEAREAFQKAIEVNPTYADAHIDLAQILDEAGSLSDAQQHLRLALENSPDNRRAHYILGDSLIRGGKFQEAISQLLDTIRVEDDKTPLCLQTLAIAYQRAGDLSHALYYTREARQRAVSRNMAELAERLQEQLDSLSAETKSP